MKTLFLSGGVQATAKLLNEALSVGRSTGMLKPTAFSVTNDKLVLTSHNGVFSNGVAVVAENAETYELESYLKKTSNSYRGTLVYSIDPSLFFEAKFSFLDDVLLQEDTDDLVIGWVVYPGGNASWSSSFFHAAPRSAALTWLDILIDVGELQGLTRTYSGYSETYVNNQATTQTVEIVRNFPTTEEIVRSLRFNGSLSQGSIVDFYVKSEKQLDWLHVSSLSGAQSQGKYRIPVFALDQGPFEMTSVRYVFRVPPSCSFTIDLIGATNEPSYTIKKF